MRSRRGGFALMPVVLMIAVIAAIAFLVTHEGASGARLARDAGEADEAHYVAEAGLRHAEWQLGTSACTGDATIPATSFGGHSYEATLVAGGSTTALSLSPSMDAWIRSDQTDKNNGAATDLHIRFESGKSEHVLLHFDVGGIATGARVNSASLWLYIQAGKEYAEGPLFVHRVSAAWDEFGVTWDGFGGAYDATAIATIPAESQSGIWVRVDLTQQVQAWVNGEANYGVLLSSASEGVHGEYESREGDAQFRPRLDVVVGTGAPSPAALLSTGTLASGAARSLQRTDLAVHGPESARRFEPDASASHDAYLAEANPDTNYGDATSADVANQGGASSLALLRFDLDGIPVGARVTNAVLSVHRKNGSGSPVPIGAHRVTRWWSEDSVSWNKAHTWDSWSTPGGDFDPVAVATTEVGPPNNAYHDWDITPLAQGWVDGTFPNYGVALRTELAGSTGEHFDTSDEASGNKRPQLTLRWACECGFACALPKSTKKLFMVTSSYFSLDATDAFKKALFESFGYQVSILDDDAWSMFWDGAIADNDLAYVSGTADPAKVGTKLSDVSIGVVSENGAQFDELGLATSHATSAGDHIEITDASHFITSAFPVGDLPLYDAAMEGLTVAGSEASGLQVLARWGGSNSLAVLDEGATASGGGPASGRRVALPIGQGANLDVQRVNANGWLLVQRALEWAGGGSSPPPPPTPLLFVVSKPSGLKSEEEAHKALLESWGYGVTLIDDGADATEFDTEVAAAEVVFLTREVNASDVGHKLDGAPIGVVTSEPGLADELGLASDAKTEGGTSITIVDATHEITSAFASGSLTVFHSSEPRVLFDEAYGDTLARLDGDPSLVALEASDPAGRRVVLPWDDIDPGNLSADGTLLLQRALAWAITPPPEAPPEPELLAHWKLDDGSGTVASDEKGSHDANLSADPPDWITTGALDGALEFDGGANALTVLADLVWDLDPTFERTWSLWIRPDQLDAEGTQLFAQTDGAGRGLVIAAHSTADDDLGPVMQGISVGWDESGGRELGLHSSFGAVSVDTWHHVVVTHDGSLDPPDRFAIWVDKVDVTDRSDVSSAGTLQGQATTSIAIGGNPVAPSSGFDGGIDDVRVYDRVLSQTEIGEIFDAAGGGAGDPPSCDASYRDEFNDDAFDGSDGQSSWSTDWIEIGESDGAKKGDVRVEDEDSKYQLRIRDNDNGGEGVEREADLSGFASAVLSFAYRPKKLDNDDDYVAISVSKDGGSSWDEIDRIAGKADDSGYTTRTHDITGWIASDTRIRFLGGPKLGDKDEVFLDDVEIAPSGCGSP